MSRMILLCAIGLALLCPWSTSAQTLELSIEKANIPPKVSLGAYLQHITQHDDGSLTLHYVEQRTPQLYFTDYTYDKTLSFDKSGNNQFKANATQEAPWQTQYPWFFYKGESYVVDGVSALPHGSKLFVRKKTTTWKYSPWAGRYLPNVKYNGSTMIEGEDQKKIYLYHGAENYQTGNAVLLVGNKASKKSKIKQQHTRHFQLLTLSKNMEVEYKEEIQFDYPMGISYFKIIDEPGLAPSSVDDATGDLSRGDLAILFAPVMGAFGKKNAHPNPAEHTLIIVDGSGNIRSKIKLQLPSSGWMVEEMVKLATGEIIAHGPAAAGQYASSVASVSSPLVGGDARKLQPYLDARVWDNFQILKLNAQLGLVYVQSTPLAYFKDGLVTPPGQDRAPFYPGRYLRKQELLSTPDGELLLSGQLYQWDKVPAKDPNGKVRYDREGKIIYIRVRRYNDLVLFHFDQGGRLRAQYSIARQHNNPAAQDYRAPINCYLNKDNSSVYVVYGEITGKRPELEGRGTKYKAKVLSYPAAAKIDLTQARISPVTHFGRNEEGQQKYFTNLAFPQLHNPGKDLTFIGEDNVGLEIWLGRLSLD